MTARPPLTPEEKERFKKYGRDWVWKKNDGDTLTLPPKLKKRSSTKQPSLGGVLIKIDLLKAKKNRGNTL